MISALVPIVLEAALRALLAAAAVWAGLRLLRVGNVLVQKAAWALVLVAALAMPLAPRWQILPTFGALRLPALITGQTSAPPVLDALHSGVQTHAPKGAQTFHVSARNAGAGAGRTWAVETDSSAPDRYSAPSISNNDQSSSVWSSSPAVSPYDEAPSASELSAEPATESTDASGSLNIAAQSVKATGPALKGARLRLHRKQQGRTMAPAAEEPRSQGIPLSASGATASIATTPNQTLLRIATCAWALYLGVFAALLLRLVVGLAAALRIWWAAIPVSVLPDGETTSGLRASTRVASPVNIGSGIVLPADYAAWDEEKLRIVLAHERSHVRQGDFYLQLLAGAYASLFWFSPLGWWLKRKLTELSEAISDRAGLEEADSRSSYAQLLLEFAALPRPTLTGVAMARSSHLAQRIERLLNETSFRQAFAAGGRRALLAVLLVPVALFCATALVRVEAAVSPQPVIQTTQDSLSGQSTPEQVTDQAAPAPATAPSAVPAPAPASSPAATPAPMITGDPVPAPMAPLPPNPAIEAMPPLPPMPQVTVRIPKDAIHVRIDPSFAADIAAARDEMKQFRAYAYKTADGDAYAVVGEPGTKARFNGVWDGDRSEEIEKARKIAHGHFLWFRHEGKSYIVDDPAVVAQVEAMNKPMDDLGKQMHELGDQMRDMGKQQREFGKQLRDITVPTPDISKQIAEMNAAFASFQAKQGATISQKELSDLQRELGRLQGELGALQGKIGAQQAGLGSGMGKFGEQQGKLGGEMGKLGAQMGQLGRENQSKIKSIIDQSLSNGKARPVE